MSRRANIAALIIRAGDAVVYIPEGAVLPEWLLKRLDMWKQATPPTEATEKTDGHRAVKAKPAQPAKGALSGPDGNRVRAMTLRGITSQGILYPVSNENGTLWLEYFDVCRQVMARCGVAVDDDVAVKLGIEQYEPVIPASMSGAVLDVGSLPMKYDFESIQSRPHLFVPGEAVVVTEKLHGTQMQAAYIPTLKHPELFGQDMCLFAASKGLGAVDWCSRQGAARSSTSRPRAS